MVTIIVIISDFSMAIPAVVFGTCYDIDIDRVMVKIAVILDMVLSCLVYLRFLM